MISADGEGLYIIDWGMGVEWLPEITYTQTCGSPDYAAPEIYQGRPYLGPEVDIWAMGVILYAMVTSDFPFPGKSPLEVAYKVCRGIYPWPLVSSSLCDLISRMLKVSQSERITLDGIRSHPWFCNPQHEKAEVSMVHPLSLSLKRSSFRSDVYEEKKKKKSAEKESSSSHKSKHRRHRKSTKSVDPQKSRRRSSSRSSSRHRKPSPELSIKQRPRETISQPLPIKPSPTGGASCSTPHVSEPLPEIVPETSRPDSPRPKKLTLHFWKKHSILKRANSDFRNSSHN